VKAIAQDTYGSTDVLELRDIDKPEIANDEVLVRVRAAGVDRGVWHLMTGPGVPDTPCGLRATQAQEPGSRPRIGRTRRSSRQGCDPVSTRR
jgi:hypothetical protein